MNINDYIKRESKRKTNQMIRNYMSGLRIADVELNGKTTVVRWGDGTETSVSCCDSDEYDAEKAIAFCVCKKIYGTQFKKALKNFTSKGYTL